ncbi:DUF4811 domain-containing protein [Levilactobacillus zymae]|uniref:DUF4811 domain-containing protein n=1 Tax=Levilactobacillus zymae TaxID=267363 RepID=UPI0028B71B2D|nr:DUF4811 domain-containing protein [Levilactobacillus zymae]MDT6981329.1 DUF4811 domain-containing protein [Levilactobacillus zymae]
MVLISLVLGILLALGGFFVPTTRLVRLLVGGLGLVILLGATVGLVGNAQQHWGMHRVTTTHTNSVASIASTDPLDVLVYQPSKGPRNQRVYTYRSTTTNRQQTTAATSQTRNRVVIGHTTTATLTTTTTSWQFRSRFWRAMFTYPGRHTALIRQQNTFELPSRWVTLTPKQTQWLKAAVKEQAKGVRQAKREAVAKIVKQQLAAISHPTAAQRRQITAKAQRAVTQELQKQAPKRAAQLAQQAQQQPAE